MTTKFGVSTARAGPRAIPSRNKAIENFAAVDWSIGGSPFGVAQVSVLDGELPSGDLLNHDEAANGGVILPDAGMSHMRSMASGRDLERAERSKVSGCNSFGDVLALSVDGWPKGCGNCDASAIRIDVGVTVFCCYSPRSTQGIGWIHAEFASKSILQTSTCHLSRLALSHESRTSGGAVFA